MKLIIPQSAFIRRNSRVREGLRRLLTAIPRHRQGPKKDILLLSSRRSGSTWVMQSLGAVRGLRSLNEPFGPKFVAESYLACFPEFKAIYRGHRLFEFPEILKPHVDEYMKKVAYSAISGPYNPMLPSYHLKTDRRLWKVIHANPAAEYFLERARRYHSFTLIRHPCPTVLSMSKKYAPELAIFLANEAFCQKHLDSSQFAVLKDIESRGDILELFAAEWALEQLVPCRLLPMYREHCPVISYEELRLNPATGFRYLADYCELDHLDAILKATNMPSASTADERLQLIQGSPEVVLESWKKYIDKETERRIFKIIQQLEIDYYEPDRLLPTPTYVRGFAGD